jgi:23S rRNA pseudouridine1911/1915/1917 synthase
MAEGVDSESCKEQSAAPPVLYAKSKSEWIEGSKAGFSIVADFGTADSVELPDGAIEPGDGPPQVKLPVLLQLMDPGRFPTASAAKKKVRQGIILVNGRKARVDMLIKIGEDNIAMQSRTESKFKPLGEAPFHIDVIYEDDVMAIVHKPQGVCTHPPKGQTEAQSMMSMRCCVPYHVKCAPPGHEGILWRPMLVHRLDKATEGLQIVGKTKRAYVDLQRQFANRLIKKQYLALVEGNIEETEGTIDLMVDNKDAVSDFKVVKRVRSGGLGMLTLLHVFPRHGRKHQIRIHCAGTKPETSATKLNAL